ncbi:LAFE_0H12970g1_1 [Lachancea fermentati]|uniref:tRNA ligase n=1 Tax=Lachancea fermentati TaxID=4955 RepID=A0A1G4MKJ9_LACFM|nr:LAFE_0H12970g1_1 [Lachancea fermentati]
MIFVEKYICNSRELLPGRHLRQTFNLSLERIDIVFSTRQKQMSVSVKKLCDDLEAASKLEKRGKAFKRICEVFNSDAHVVSWKFNEWDYGKNSIHLPCNARGLFISESLEDPRIVARGYDKFFNIDEVYFTRWDWLTENTKGPYEITVKENGCIIFISGLEDGSLLVCSKHSTGPRDDGSRNHALAGEKFLRRQLEARGINPITLARKLYEMNATAVAEYCDDSFEEHILEYSKDKAGLYLHGINLNQQSFSTLSMKDVHEFAECYGFNCIEYLTIESLDSLKDFLEHCSTTGSYKNKEIEGFVIRCKTLDDSAFFFKYKFEEPYLMYRQWREVTKDYIKTKSRIFKFKKHKFITNKYLDFVIPLLRKNPKLCEDFMADIGIIKLRKMFLDHYGFSGIEILNHERIQELELQNAVDYDKVDESTKFLFFPIATIGCGKTTTALTLTNLFPNSWGHVQNDDITGKDKKMLMKKSLELLAKDGMKAVIVDRNNHQFRERRQLFEWFEELKEDYLPYDCNVKIIALSFFPYEEISSVYELAVKRVLERGDNHQSIKASAKGEKKVLGIMRGFVDRYQPVVQEKSPDNQFDLVIQLNVREKDSSLSNAENILRELHRHYPILIPQLPTHATIREALHKSLQYRPSVTKIVKGGSRNQNKDSKFKPVYFFAGIRNKNVLIDCVSSLIEEKVKEPFLEQKLQRALGSEKTQPEFHITLCHVVSGKNGSKEQKDMWCEFNKRYSKKLLKSNSSSDVRGSSMKTGDVVKFRLHKLMWDDKIMTLLVQLEKECVHDGKSGDIVPRLSCANKFSHITVSILQQGVKPFYSNELCERMEELHPTEEGCFSDGLNCFEFSNPLEFDAEVCIQL